LTWDAINPEKKNGGDLKNENDVIHYHFWIPVFDE
jgi:hypothetical protein